MDKDEIIQGNEGAQVANKTGKHSSAQKPSNSGPDSHGEHKTGPVPGAFGKDLPDTTDHSDNRTH